MNREQDSIDIYNLLLERLKTALNTQGDDVKVLKLALDFVKTFSLEDKLETEQTSMEEFIENLPFK